MTNKYLLFFTFDLHNIALKKALLHFHKNDIIILKVKWLSDEEISYFKSDFKFVLEYLRMERTGNAEEWGRQKVSHIHDLLNLLKSISRNENVTT